jgi:hypothetical protein
VQIGQLFFFNFFFSRAGPRSVPDRAAQLQQQRRAEEERAARARERAQALLKVLSCCFLLQRCFTAAFYCARARPGAAQGALLLLYYCFTTALLLLYYCNDPGAAQGESHALRAHVFHVSIKKQNTQKKKVAQGESHAL